MAHEAATARALADADRRFAHVKAINEGMVDIAARLLREHGDPTKAWSVLGLQMMKGAGIEQADQAAYVAVESLAALYIEQAQARTPEEPEDRGPQQDQTPTEGEESL